MEGFGQKRFADNQLGGLMVPAKRTRQEIVPFNNYNQQIVAAVRYLCRCGLIRVNSVNLQGPPRTSSLNAPIMQLFGHEVHYNSAYLMHLSNVLSHDGANILYHFPQQWVLKFVR